MWITWVLLIHSRLWLYCLFVMKPLRKKIKITVSTRACHATLMPAAERYVTALSPQSCLYMKRVALLLSTNHVLQLLERHMPQYIHILKYPCIECYLSWCWKCSQYTTLRKNFMMSGPMHDYVLHSGAMLHIFFLALIVLSFVLSLSFFCLFLSSDMFNYNLCCLLYFNKTLKPPLITFINCLLLSSWIYAILRHRHLCDTTDSQNLSNRVIVFLPFRACVGARDPYCGWDLLLKKCTTLEESVRMSQWEQSITKCPVSMSLPYDLSI